MKRRGNGSSGLPNPEDPKGEKDRKNLGDAAVLHFKASVAQDASGRFRAAAPEFPSLVAYGASREEALAGLEAAVLRHLAASSTVSLEAVFGEVQGVVPYSALSAGENLYVATNLDMVLVSQGGARESFRRSAVTQQPSEVFQVFEDEQAEELFDRDEYATQIYALASFTPRGGRPGIYAGTNLKGLVYANEGGEEWRPAFSTGEERIHALAGFGNFLYAGTSSQGRIYRWDGRHRTDMVHQSTEMGVTALAVFKGALYAGTYPEGLILRSEDGELWEIAWRSEQRLINQFLEASGTFYAACSDDKGGAIMRSSDGISWERCFFSDQDPNVYSLAYYSGRIYAGTGESGRLFASQDGEHWQMAVQSSEAALRVLAAHRGRLYVGTAQRGRLYRTVSTEAPAPTIRAVQINQLSSSRAVLEWSTDVPCETLVQFGAGAVRDQTINNPSLSRQHRATLEGLKAGVNYTFLIKARSAEGSEAVHLSDQGFTTPVLAPPSLASQTHPEEEKWVSSREARVAWAPLSGASRYVVKLGRDRITSLSLKDEQTDQTSYSGELEGDGVWWFAVAGVDEADNVGEVSVRALRCDTVAAVPVVSSPSHPEPETWYNLSAVEFQARGADDASGVDGFLFAIGRVGESWERLAFQQAAGDRWSLPRLPDGTWEIFIRLRDRAGNESQPTSHRVRIDTTPPVVSLDPLPALAKAGPIELHWQARDEQSGIGKVMIQQRREGGGAKDADWETVFEGLASSAKVEGQDGWRVWYRVVAADKAGQQAAASAPQPVLFDGSPPTPVTVLETSSLAGGDIMLKWGPSRDEFSEVARYVVYRGTEEGSLGMRVGLIQANVLEFIDDGVGLAHGAKYYYRIGSEDSFGNSQTEGLTVAGVCDKEAPSPQLSCSTHPPDEWTTQTEAELDWPEPEDDSGIREYVWRIDRNPVSTLVRGVDGALAKPPLRISHLKDGLWYVHVASVDGAGNMSTASTYALRVVTKPPHARLKPLPSMLSSSKVRLEWEREENVVAVAIGMRGGGERSWRVLVEQADGNGREVEVEGEGVFEFSVRALDSFGRWGVWEEGQVTLIDVSPPLEIPVLEAKTQAGGKILLKWDASWDELSGLAGYRVRRTRQGESKGETVAEIPATGECVYLDNCEDVEEGQRFVYAVWPVDMAGNVLEAGPLAEGVVDRSAPMPRLICRSHPDPTRSYSSRRLEVFWNASHDLTGVRGIVVELNSSPATEPNPETLPLRAAQTLTFEVPEDGRWFVHARTVDGAGNASDTAHLSAQVDTHVDPPVVSFPSDPFLEWRESGTVAVTVKPPEDPSGVPAFWYVLDQSPTTEVDKLNGTREEGGLLRVKPKAEGVWHVHVAAEDGAGNISNTMHLMMRLVTGLSMPRMLSCSHPEGFWSQKREVEMEWERVEGDRVSYYYWLAKNRQDAPPESAMRVDDPKCRITIDEGAWYWHVCAVDERGRKSSPLAYQLRVDATPPSIAIESPSHPKGRWVTKRRVQYVIEASDGHSGMARVELAVTPAGQEPDIWELALGGEGEREVPGEGQWTIWARGVDSAGNISPSESWGIQVDLAAPAPGVSSATHPEGEWSDSLDAEFLLQPAGDLSGIAEYAVYLFRSIDEIPSAPPEDALRTMNETVPIKVPEDGRWSLAVWAKDMADNLSPVTRYNFAVDTSALPPTGFVIEPSGEGGWIRSSSVKAFWKYAEEVSGEPDGYLYCCDRAADTVPEPGLSAYAALPELEIVDLEDGINYLHVRTIDAAGNVSPGAVHVKMALDSNPPSLTLAAQTQAGTLAPGAESPDWIRDRRVSISAESDDGISGVTGFLWTLHESAEEKPDIMNGGWKEEPSWNVEVPRDGTWEIAVAAQDGAGNLSEPARITLKVDATALPPENLRVESHPEPERWYSARKAAVSWNEPGEASGVKRYRYRLLPAGEAPGAPESWEETADSRLELEVPKDGKWSFLVATEDNAGNLSGPAQVGFMVDSEIPRPRVRMLTHHDPDVWYASGTVEVEVDARDEASGIKQTLMGVWPEEKFEPDILKPLAARRGTLALEKGVWWIHVMSEDNAGNRSQPVSRKVMIDPAVKPPLVVCESHPDHDAWYSNAEVRYRVMPAGEEGRARFWAVFDDKSDTHPTKESGFSVIPGLVKVNASHSGEWYLHVVSMTEGAGLATEAVHVRARVDTTVPEAPAIMSSTHFTAPRRSKNRTAVFEWNEPHDLAGIKGYNYTASRQSMLGMRREKTGSVEGRTLSLEDLEQGNWELTISAVDGAGQAGAPGKYSFVVSDSQDLALNVKSESWRVGQSGMEIDLRSEHESFKKGRTDAGGEAHFRDIPYGTYSVTISKEKSGPPLEFDGILVDEGEEELRMEISVAGCAWMICRDTLRLWVPKMWIEGGIIELSGKTGPLVAAHKLKDLQWYGAFLECPLPPTLRDGQFKLRGGALKKLDWPPLSFRRLP